MVWVCLCHMQDFSGNCKLGTLTKKIYGIIWEFFPNGPLFGNPLLQKKIRVSFAFLPLRKFFGFQHSVWRNPKSERNLIRNFFLIPNFYRYQNFFRYQFFSETDTDIIKTIRKVSKPRSSKTKMSHSYNKSLWFHDLALLVRLFFCVYFQIFP